MDSMLAVCQVFEDIRPKLNLATNPPVRNLEPLDVKRYLTENCLMSCVLVVDAKIVKDAYEKLPRPKVEYQELLETAAKEVCKN